MDSKVLYWLLNSVLMMELLFNGLQRGYLYHRVLSIIIVLHKWSMFVQHILLAIVMMGHLRPHMAIGRYHLDSDEVIA